MATHQPRFSFDIADLALAVTPQDTEVISDVAFSTGLGHDDYCPLLTRAFSKVLGTPLPSCVSKAQFDAAMRALLPEVAEWSDVRKEHMSFFLSNIFYAFDRESRESVPTDEVLVALSFLCGGSKTAKLAFAFSVFDEGGQGALEQAEAARLLTALLTGLFALCAGSNVDALDDEVEDAVHRCAVRTALDMFKGLGLSDDEPLTFDHFGSWYNHFGFETIQWLELLDLGKWPGAAAIREARAEESSNSPAAGEAEWPPPPPPRSPGAAFSGGGGGGPGAVGTAATAGASSFSSSSVISFDFPAPLSAKVAITEEDVGRLAQILNLTDMHKLAPSEASAALLALGEEGLLSRRGFAQALRRLVAFEQLIEDAMLDEKEALQVVGEIEARFFAFYGAFERHKANAGVAVDELAAGWSLLCAGSKSDKLAHAWEVLCAGKQGVRLSRRGLWRFLRSFLLMLMAMSRDGGSGGGGQGQGQGGPRDLTGTADSGAVWTAALVFDETTRAEEHSISFDEFAEWYTNGGFAAASWFELLDLKKWVMAPPTTPEDEDAAAAPQRAEDDEEEESGEVSEDEEDEEESDDDYVPSGTEEEEDEASDEDTDDETSEGDGGQGEESGVGEDEEEEHDAEEEEEEEEEDAEDAEEESVVFSFQLTEAGHCLFITSADSASVLRVVALSSLFDMTCDELADALSAHAMPDPDTGVLVLPMSGYNAAMRALLPASDQLRGGGTGDDATGGAACVRFLTTALANVYFAFVPLDGDAAPLAELTTGLSLFVQGSKSIKLQHGFGLFDSDGDELLDGAELSAFLGAVLSVLFACAKQTAALPPDQSRALVHAATTGLVRRVLGAFATGTRGNGGGQPAVSFEDFGAWYNDEGCEVAPWLELLDLSKWHLQPLGGGGKAAAATAAIPSGGGGGGYAYDEEEYADESGAEGEEARDESGAEGEEDGAEGGGGAGEARPSSARPGRAGVGRTAGWAAEMEADDDSDDDSSEEDDDVDDEDEAGSGGQGEADEDVEDDYDDYDAVAEGGGEGGGDDDLVGEARFSFPLVDATGEPNPQCALRLSHADVSSLKLLVRRTGLGSLDPASVCAPLLAAARNGLLSKPRFDACVRRLVPAASLSKEERGVFSVLLSAVFFNFEATSESSGGGGGNGQDGSLGEDCANALELAMGMALLCGGDKSAKLNYAWTVIDLDEDGLLNRAELLFFLRAFLRMLLALSFEASSLGPHEVRRHATDMASWLSGTVVQRYADPADGLVSFDDFAAWYHEGFHQVAPWLELLDLSKWVL